MTTPSGRRSGLAARLMGPVPIVCIAAVSAGAVVIGYGLGGPSSSQVWQARQAAVDPPQLWSMEAVPQPAGWAPVHVCTDSVLRAGFAKPLPVSGGQPCVAVGDPVLDKGRYAYRCQIGGRMQGVSSTVAGDLRRDFVSTFTVTDLAAFLVHAGEGGGVLQQTRRYRNLGPCPADWAIGDHSDRHGVHRRGALVDQNGL